MNSRDAARLMFVGMGVLCLVYALSMIQGVFFVFNAGEDLFSRIMNRIAGILPLLCFVWFSVHLIRHRNRYSEQLFPEVTVSKGGISPGDIHIVGISLIGVLLIVSAIPDFFRYGSWAIINIVQAVSTRSVVTGEFGTPTTSYPMRLEGLISSIGELALGVVLVWFPSKITAFLFHRKEKKTVTESLKLACPSCGHPYSLADYREDVQAMFCSKCRAQLPEKNDQKETK